MQMCSKVLLLGNLRKAEYSEIINCAIELNENQEEEICLIGLTEDIEEVPMVSAADDNKVIFNLHALVALHCIQNNLIKSI